MPPADSPRPPSSHGQRAQTPPSYISALSEALESPVTQDVYNLAATLTTQVQDNDADAADDSLRHLRAARDHDRWRLERSQDRLRALERERSELELGRNELEHRDRTERLRRVMNRLGRLHDDARAAYGDRIPSQNSLYDWSPANEADDEDELNQILAELRREQPNARPDTLRMLGLSQLNSERERSRAIVSRLLNSNQPSQSTESSLRSAAILQSVRRHPRFAARTRDYSQRYHADREPASRSESHAAPRDLYRPSESGRQGSSSMLSRLSERAAEQTRERDMLARVDSYRRGYLDRTGTLPASSTASSPMLEETIKYLSRIRSSNGPDDSLNYAIEGGCLAKDYFREDHQDFVLDPSSIPPPAETSWLAPGAVLSGCQHATTVTSTVTIAPGASTTLYRFRNNDSMTSTLLDPPGRTWLDSSYTSRSRSTSGPEVVTSHSPQQDRWPVKVTIHAVDYTKMTLSATMDAYNVPSHPHSHQTLHSDSLDGGSTHQHFTRTSSITTYLEGEILDFNTHTLLTESFTSDPGTDAMYWRKLPPFQMLTDEEIVRNLTSRRWYEEVLSKEWILMRWKERCFVKSLNRSTANTVQPPPPPPNPSLASTSFSSTRPDAPHLTSSFHSSSTRENHNPTGNSSSSHNYYWSATTTTTTSGADAEHSTFDDSDNGCGLTISGFYYVCLRRKDGRLEGLYYDKQSSPYQCLKLESIRGGVFPAWGFR